jgi:hypothetical protein
MPEGLKKKGRPSKREKMKKAKDALAGLEKWLNKTTYTFSDGDGQPVASTSASTPVSTHILLSNPPMTSRNHYQTQKFSLLEDITSENSNAAALERANHAVLARLKKIDRIAAEKGLEVGGEGGERTGLERVEKAVAELDGRSSTWVRGGILGLLEGGGLT